MSQINSGSITGTNEQLQAIRPYLVEEGFVDDKRWNDTYTVDDRNILIEINRNINDKHVFTIYHYGIGCLAPIYSLSPDEDLKEAAKIIKQKFYGY